MNDTKDLARSCARERLGSRHSNNPQATPPSAMRRTILTGKKHVKSMHTSTKTLLLDLRIANTHDAQPLRVKHPHHRHLQKATTCNDDSKQLERELRIERPSLLSRVRRMLTVQILGTITHQSPRIVSNLLLARSTSRP